LLAELKFVKMKAAEIAIRALSQNLFIRGDKK
jgi:hypothetical protein